MKNKILNQKEFKIKNIYFMKYITTNKKVNRVKKIEDIIDKNRIFKESNIKVNNYDNIAYNL